MIIIRLKVKESVAIQEVSMDFTVFGGGNLRRYFFVLSSEEKLGFTKLDYRVFN